MDIELGDTIQITYKDRFGFVVNVIFLDVVFKDGQIQLVVRKT